jgi:hypothetical protein
MNNENSIDLITCATDYPPEIRGIYENKIKYYKKSDLYVYKNLDIGVISVLDNLSVSEVLSVCNKKFRIGCGTTRVGLFHRQLNNRSPDSAQLMEFIDEEKIDGVETGCDIWTVDGQYPQYGMYGWEIKDQCYIGKITQTALMPKAITYVNSKLSKVFKEEESRGFFSTEVRVDKDKNPFLMDFTARCGNPPYQLHLEMIDNLLEVMYEGAKGNLIEPKYNSKYGAVAIIESEFAEENWMPIQIEEDAKKWIKIMNMCVIDGITYSLPIYGLSEIGAVVGTGNTLQEAIDNCKKHADQIKGYKLTVETLSFDEAEKVIEEGKKFGVMFN